MARDKQPITDEQMDELERFDAEALPEEETLGSGPDKRPTRQGKGTHDDSLRESRGNPKQRPPTQDAAWRSGQQQSQQPADNTS